MSYIYYVLTFCAIMLLFEWAWKLIVVILFFISKSFKSVLMIKIGMYVEKILYSFSLTTIAASYTNRVFSSNSQIGFQVFAIFIPIFYFIILYGNMRRQTSKHMNDEEFIQSTYFQKIDIIKALIEIIFIVLFIPFIFFPNLHENIITITIFNTFNYIANIYVLGSILGIYGMIQLVKYAFGIWILLIQKLTTKNQNF